MMKCLPSHIKPETVIASVAVKLKNGVVTERPVTVRETLKKLGARCCGPKLLDRKGREIRFFTLQGCWGNPPADYLEILAAQAKEIKELKKKYTVIEIQCRVGGKPDLSSS